MSITEVVSGLQIRQPSFIISNRLRRVNSRFAAGNLHIFVCRLSSASSAEAERIRKMAMFRAQLYFGKPGAFDLSIVSEAVDDWILGLTGEELEYALKFSFGAEFRPMLLDSDRIIGPIRRFSVVVVTGPVDIAPISDGGNLALKGLMTNLHYFLYKKWAAVLVPGQPYDLILLREA